MGKRQTEQVLQATNFLHGCKNKQIRHLLAKYGFTPQERAKGAQLLLAVLGDQAGIAPTPEETFQKSLLDQIDAWENLWFPIAEVVLSQYYPALYRRIFHELSQTEGFHVIASVSTFLFRLERLASSSDDLDKTALAHLERRGLQPQERQKAKDLLSQLLGLEDFPTEEALLQNVARQKTSALAHLANPPDAEDSSQEDLEEPEDPPSQEALLALEQWYREWSVIARKALTRKDHLIALGLRQRAAKKETPA